MQFDHYVSQVQSQLAAAAALGDERTRAAAEALATAAGPAIRLALLGAATVLADEITAALLDAPGAPAVSVRLDGDDLRTEIRVSEPTDPAGEASATNADDAESTARISLRLPDTLKVQIETAARHDGVSINTWIVRAASSALSGGRWSKPRATGGGQRITGWING
jgi:hypothetical protein